MIEKICTQIIKDLGPTGLLVIGIYFILHTSINKIMTPLTRINEELGEIRDILRTLVIGTNIK